MGSPGSGLGGGTGLRCSVARMAHKSGEPASLLADPLTGDANFLAILIYWLVGDLMLRWLALDAAHMQVGEA